MYMTAMEEKCRNMCRVNRVYLTHLFPALQKIQKRRSSVTQRQRAIRLEADICLAHTAKKGSAWSRALNLRLIKTKKAMTTMKMKEASVRRSRSVTQARRLRLASVSSRCWNTIDIETGGHDHDAIYRRLGTLQRLVPGGRNMGVDALFQETADYILNLQRQVHAMEVLAELYTINSAGTVDDSITQHQQESAGMDLSCYVN